MSAHTCHAMGCKRSCPPKYLMHPGHWRMVPKADQLAVLATYRPGQEIDMDPSPAYLQAAMEAVMAVAIKEGYTDEEIKAAPEVQMYARWLGTPDAEPATPEPEQKSLFS